jgi:hypothetical protein
MARQPEVEPWPPIKDASKLACLEKRKCYINKKKNEKKRKKQNNISGTQRRRPNEAHLSKGVSKCYEQQENNSYRNSNDNHNTNKDNNCK